MPEPSFLVRREVVAAALEANVTPMVKAIREGIEHSPSGRDPDAECEEAAWERAAAHAGALDEFYHRMMEGEFDVGAY